MINAPRDKSIGAIENIDDAITFFIDNHTAAMGKLIRWCTSDDGKRYAAVVQWSKYNAFGFADTHKYFVIYKKQWEWQYAKNWKKRGEQIGINATPEMVRQAMLAEAFVAFVFIDRSAWQIKASTFWDFAIQNETMGDRDDGKGGKYPEIACPKSLLARMKGKNS